MACYAFSWPFPLLAEPFSFDDIEFWVGEGANRAAVAVDWAEADDSEAALVWGYRWNGSATGRDMLVAVLSADERLFAKLGDVDGDPQRVFGIGYDADGDGEFGIDDDSLLDESGIVIGTPPFFPAGSLDPDDLYAEGWRFAFWHYGNAEANPYAGEGNWVSSTGQATGGMANRRLADGAWDSWVFSPSLGFAGFAENPIAAPAPRSLPGDFNGDGHIDALDYGVWKSTFGSRQELRADANANGIVDAADYTLWRDQFVRVLNGTSAVSHNVPEPTPLRLWMATVCVFALRLRRYSSWGTYASKDFVRGMTPLTTDLTSQVNHRDSESKEKKVARCKKSK